MILLYKRRSAPVWWVGLMVVLLVAGLTRQTAFAQAVRYVKPASSGSGTGASWQNATGDLQAAINASNAGDEVWVAAGTYKPGGNTNTNRSLSFTLKSGVKLYGGFEGTETALSQRSATQTATLSGELGNTSLRTDNSYHVIRNTGALAAGTLLDGFTISDGQSDGNGEDSYGGGLYNVLQAGVTASLTLRNCTFTRNHGGTTAGAILTYANSGGSTTINCFSCTFESNTARYSGAALFIGKNLFDSANNRYFGNTAATQVNCEDCQFRSNSVRAPNQNGQGGALFFNNRGDATVSTFKRCRFVGNGSNYDGGVMYNQNGSPEFQNCGFVNNTAAQGGVLTTFNDNQSALAQPKFTNCSFTLNRTLTTDIASPQYGGVFFVGTRSRIQVNNSIVSGNDGANSIVIYDTGFSSVTATNSVFDQSVTGYTGSGNVTTTTTPFSSTVTLDVRPCPPVLNGSLATLATPALIGSTDLNGKPRFFGSAAEIGAVEYGQNTQAASGGTITANGQTTATSICVGSQTLTVGSSNDGFSYGNYAWQMRLNAGNWTTLNEQIGATLTTSLTVAAGQATEFRRVAVDCSNTPFYSNILNYGTYSTDLIAGTISGPTLVPDPQEGSPMLNSTANATAGFSLSITWQQSDNGTTWTNISNSNAQSIPLPALTTGPDLSNKPFYFRRVAQHGCPAIASAVSASVAVTTRKVEGAVQGKVVSGDGTTGVRNVTVTMVRTTPGLAGSPDNYTYTAITDDDGVYRFSPVYWGFPTGTPGSSVTASGFTITPRYGTHVFDPTNRNLTMNNFNKDVTLPNFKDLSTYALKGSVVQRCTDCLLPNQSVQTGLIECPLDSAMISVVYPPNNLTLVSRSQSLENVYGRWAQTVIQQGNYTVVPKYKQFSFSPTSYSIDVQNDVTNLNFTTTNSVTVVGRLTAGCQDPIGKALLEFQDVAKKNASPAVCFRKRITTDNAGFYTIVLPARQYIVKVVSFTATQNADVIGTEVVQFFQDQIDRDSVARQAFIRDLTSVSAVTEFNLVYPRKPTIALSALPQTPGCGNLAPTKRLEQGVPTSLTVTVYQGAVAKGCPFTSGTVTVSGNVVDDAGTTQKLAVSNTGTVSLTMTAGLPNPIAPYQRFLNFDYKDPYARSAITSSETVVVTGVKSGTAMFETVSPQLPYLVLHDPPGDNSYSYREGSVSTRTVRRTYVGGSAGVNAWLKVKVGVKVLTGIGISVPTEAWGLAGGAVDVRGGGTKIDEDVHVVTTTQRIQTSGASDFVGPDADVYYGVAQNMYYSVGTEVLFDTDSCKFRVVKRLIMAYGSFVPGTEYAYTAGFIRNSVIPNLKTELASLSDVDTKKRIYLQSQAKIWEDLLKQQEINRRRAFYYKTISFSGGVNVEESVSISHMETTNAYEWSFAIDAQAFYEAFAEVAGTGTQGGVVANIKVETGGSGSDDVTNAATTGFVLSDNDMGDAVAVDVKQDLAYLTPLFDVVAGKTSCPPESGTQPRDDVQFYATQPIRTDIPTTTAAEYILKLGNLSTVLGGLDGSRTFFVSMLAASNPDGAIVTINGNTQLQNVQFGVTRGQEIQITVRVEKAPSSAVFSYENLQFVVTDACGGAVLKTVSISAYFKGECSNVAFVIPEPDWAVTVADANILPVQFNGYTLNSLGRVALEYRPVGESSWFEGFGRTQSQLNNSPAGTSVDWNTAGLADGQYDIRLKLTCTLTTGAVGTVYSQRLRGRVDRTPPALFGNTQPLSNTFVTGDVIGATYDEPLNCSRIKTNGGAVLARTRTGQTIPVTIGCATNQITLMPTSSLAPYIGEVLSVTLSGIADVYGNVKPQPDVWYFDVKSAPAATGSRAVSLVAASQTGDKAGNSGSILEDAAGTVDFTFQLPQAATNNIFVYFSVAGTARFGSDYTVSYGSSSTTAQPLSATLNGNDGLIMIPQGASSVTLKIDPVADTRFEPDETVILSLLSGGDYGISAASSVTATILNDDAQTNVITSVRSGPWENPDTWDQERVPVAADQVIVDQNHAVTISTTGVARKLTPRLNARLRMPLPVSKLRLGF